MASSDAKTAGDQDGDDRIDAEQDDAAEHRIGAEADEGLLADRDQPGITGKQVPVLRQHQHGEDEEQILDDAARDDEGAAKASSSRAMTATAEKRRRPGARLDREGWNGHGHRCTSIDGAREEAARLEQEDDKEGEMPGKDLPFRIDRSTHRLRHAEDDAAGKRAPERTEPADDDRLEGIDQPRRSGWSDRNWRGCRDRARRSSPRPWQAQSPSQRCAAAGCPSARPSPDRPTWRGRRGRRRCGRSAG